MLSRTGNQKGKIIEGGVGVVTVNGKEKKLPKSQSLGLYKFSHAQFEKDGVIVDTNVPDNWRSNIYFQIVLPSLGTFIIALHYKGREKAILEMDLKINDLLDKQKENVVSLDLEYVQLLVSKTLTLLNKVLSSFFFL
ncbi:hypothetical protein BY996DRAFT_4577025 [Phakopsora pachyrhizi]|uniref:Uncharacterized protein n=1 Tax=Phakopsora pachyrhizi TaxID=170000 RepID=A0AAV0B600_PHAPC|nr:hypothetical protein BY996DRAFT_4577025 [Phakopsora pachyrhizi]CAH7681012.1 hypothetical protein PPACK8108_LOCUS13553 [Phakopsora pachyrhizi]